MSSLKPLILYGDTFRANPWKVVMILEELNLPYEHKFFPISEIKSETFTKLNPNGRLPALIDPNKPASSGSKGEGKNKDEGESSFTIWESAAVVEYLIESYDTKHTISYSRTQDPEKYWHCRQWNIFQASGQGPYYGQAAWFRLFHEEKLPSAIKRYDEQVERVFGVLDKVLQKQKWLVGDKCTYVDIAFLPWDLILLIAYGGKEKWDEMGWMEKYPAYKEWRARVVERPAVKKSLRLREEAMKEAGM